MLAKLTLRHLLLHVVDQHVFDRIIYKLCEGLTSVPQSRFPLLASAKMAFSVFGLLALLPTVFAVQQNYTFNLVNTVLAPDGFERSTVTNNGIFPYVFDFSRS